MAISAGVGLFCGGTQRTALVIRVSTSVEAIRRISAVVARSESRLEKCRVEEIAGKIASEWTPGPVGPANAGRKTDNQQARIRGPE